MAIENARLVRDSEEKGRMERELAVAAEIQMALLPPRNYSRGTIELAGTTVPCRAIGGDFYEYIELADGRVGFALCDVSGKGPAAALLAAAIQGMLSATAESRPRPGHLHGAAQPHAVAPQHRPPLRHHRLRADRRPGRAAAHERGPQPGVPARSATAACRVLDKGGLMVGAFPGLSYEQDDRRARARATCCCSTPTA